VEWVIVGIWGRTLPFNISIFTSIINDGFFFRRFLYAWNIDTMSDKFIQSRKGGVRRRTNTPVEPNLVMDARIDEIKNVATLLSYTGKSKADIYNELAQRYTEGDVRTAFRDLNWIDEYGNIIGGRVIKGGVLSKDTYSMFRRQLDRLKGARTEEEQREVGFDVDNFFNTLLSEADIPKDDEIYQRTLDSGYSMLRDRGDLKGAVMIMKGFLDYAKSYKPSLEGSSKQSGFVQRMLAEGKVNRTLRVQTPSENLKERIGKIRKQHPFFKKKVPTGKKVESPAEKSSRRPPKIDSDSAGENGRKKSPPSVEMNTYDESSRQLRKIEEQLSSLRHQRNSPFFKESFTKQQQETILQTIDELEKSQKEIRDKINILVDDYIEKEYAGKKLTRDDLLPKAIQTLREGDKVYGKNKSIPFVITITKNLKKNEWEGTKQREGDMGGKPTIAKVKVNKDGWLSTDNRTDKVERVNETEWDGYRVVGFEGDVIEALEKKKSK
jgi:hypothetical protein